MLCISLTGKTRKVSNFDWNWRFARYGLQADGTRTPEPEGLQAVDFDDSDWRTLDLPHDWGVEGPFRADLEGYTGKLPWRAIGWYRKHFDVSGRDRSARLYLDFDGAMAHAEVWVNGQKAGGRPYGYSSFRIDMTPYIRFGAENVVAVRLNTEELGSRWYPGAGIYRHVRLVQTQPVHVGQWGVFVRTPRVTEESADALVTLTAENHLEAPARCSYTVEIYELDAEDRVGRRVARAEGGALQLAAGGRATDSLLLSVPCPGLWSLEHPARYVARVLLSDENGLVDCYDQPFGFRTIGFSHDDGFTLNGRKVKLQGTCNHHDLGALGAAVNTAALRRQLTILKSFGCNALRTSHNPPAPELLDLADKMGFLVLDEAFDCWQHQKKEGDYASLFDEWHVEDLGTLIRRDRNHPSVIMWSTGNEVYEQYTPECGMARHLTEVVHRFDDTRPATFGASFARKSAFNGTELQVDVHGMNYAVSAYGRSDLYEAFLQAEGHEHIVGYSSESSSTISSRGEYFPRKFQMTAYDTREPGWGSLPDAEFAALDRNPGICGEFVWTGFDYIGEPTPFNSDNSVLLNHAGAMTAEELDEQRRTLEAIDRDRPTSRSSYFGIVDMAGFPKDRYYLYQSHWIPEMPMAHLLPHWNHPDRLGQPIPVCVYTSGDEAELFLNGRSLGRKRKGRYEYRLKWDSVAYEPGELKVTAYRNGRIWAEDRVQTTGKACRLQLTPDKGIVRSDGDDLVFVRISCLDSLGREVPDAEPVISCHTEGCGRVIATDNGDATCLITFSETTRPAFNGLLLAIVKPQRGKSGKIRLRAEAPGMESAEITLRVKRK